VISFRFLLKPAKGITFAECKNHPIWNHGVPYCHIPPLGRTCRVSVCCFCCNLWNRNTKVSSLPQVS